MAKVLVSLDDRLLERLDHEAAHRGVSRSALIADLAAKGLGEPLGPGATPRAQAALRHIRELLRDAPPGDSTPWFRAERDAR